MVDRTKLIGELVSASEEVAQRVLAVIEGKEQRQPDTLEGRRLLTITETQDRLHWKYGKVYRAIDEGLLDVVNVLGQRHVTEQSIIEMSEGRRQSSVEAVRKRNERNSARREAYRRNRSKAKK